MRRAVRRDERDDATNATERSETKFTHSLRTVRDARLASSTDRRVASRVAHPRPSLLASRTRASRSNLEKKSIPYLFVRTLDGGDRLDRGRALRDGGVGLLRDRDRGAGDGGGHGVHLLCDVRVFVWCVEGVRGRSFVCRVG